MICSEKEYRGSKMITTEAKRMDVRTMTLCGLFAALTAVGAFIRIPMPVVPFTLQFFFVALAGVLLGAKRGAMAQMIYVAVGLIGIPVFTKGGGLQYVFEPSFGYLIGFIVAAYAIGYVSEKLGKVTFRNLLLATLVGISITYIFGVTHMYMIFNFYLGKSMSVGAAITAGAITFMPSDFTACVVTSLVGSKIVPYLRNAKLI